MIQVKVLIETDEEELEEVVNSFLEDMDELEVLSIQTLNFLRMQNNLSLT